jgi:hypothetical protein
MKKDSHRSRKAHARLLAGTGAAVGTGLFVTAGLLVAAQGPGNAWHEGANYVAAAWLFIAVGLFVGAPLGTYLSLRAKYRAAAAQSSGLAAMLVIPALIPAALVAGPLVSGLGDAGIGVVFVTAAAISAVLGVSISLRHR